MSEKKTNRENRRRRRRRNQMISYCVMAVVLIAVGIGCFLGIRVAGSAVKQHQAAREESRQELLEASRVEESAQAQAAVAALFETESTEETESTYTKEDALNDMVEGYTRRDDAGAEGSGTFFCDAGAADGSFTGCGSGRCDQRKPGKISGRRPDLFCTEYPVGKPVKRNAFNTASYSLFPLFFGVDEEGRKRLRALRTP